MSAQNYQEITSAEHFKQLLSADLERVSLINFWAPWAAPCEQMNQVSRELANKYEDLLVLQVEAEEQSDIAESFEIEAVPSFLILRGHTLLGRIAGADAQALTKAVATHVQPTPEKKLNILSKLSGERFQPSTTTNSGSIAYSTPTEKHPEPQGETPEELEARMRRLMNQSKVVLFMKGTPDVPRCGFSRRTVSLLRDHNVDFTSFDILEDEDVRQGLKTLNNWPTFPQIIVNGELIGGLDILTESIENGEFAEQLAAEPHPMVSA